MSSTWSGLFVFNRLKILLVVSLIATWSIASLIPQWRPMIQDKVVEQLSRTRQKIPSIKIDFHPNKDPRTAYNSSKLAMIIEPKPIPHLVPQLLHMMSIVPPDWRFLFIGSNQSVSLMAKSTSVQYHQKIGKLDLMIPPKPFSIAEKEHIWRMLTDVRFYDELLPGVEWLLKYESDAIMCANSEDSLNDWLHYDWAGSPRTATDRFAGNGGLSIRRLSAVRRILSFQARYNNTEAEDEWFGKRLVNTPGLRVAKAEEQNHFAVEEIYHEKPMGYHLRAASGHLPVGVWKNRTQRQAIFKYCPEISIVLDMKLEQERCEGDNGEGKLEDMPKPGRR